MCEPIPPKETRCDVCFEIKVCGYCSICDAWLCKTCQTDVLGRFIAAFRIHNWRALKFLLLVIRAELIPLVERLPRTNWKASTYWSIFHRQFIWIGQHGSDYTQVCASCTTVVGGCSCISSLDCPLSGASCTCNCPAPSVANSSLTSTGTCTLTTDCTGTTCGGAPKRCSGIVCSTSGTACGYTCNGGFKWDGTICRPIMGAITSSMNRKRITR